MRGRFGDVWGVLSIADPPERSTGHVEIAELGGTLGQKALLDSPRDSQILFDALRLDQLFALALEVRGHLIERGRHHAEFVLAAHRNPIVEIPGSKALCRGA